MKKNYLMAVIIMLGLSAQSQMWESLIPQPNALCREFVVHNSIKQQSIPDFAEFGIIDTVFSTEGEAGLEPTVLALPNLSPQDSCTVTRVHNSLTNEFDTFLQRDLSDVLGFVISKTDTTLYATEDYELWRNYLSRPQPSVATLGKYFTNASVEFEVPRELLMIIGQKENNWVQIGPSIDRGWGVMHLVENEYCNTLSEASLLLGIDKQILKDDAQQNIRGAAALIAHYAGNESHNFSTIEDWFDAVKKFTGLINEELRELQAKSYYDALNEGVNNPTLWGETIVIQPVKNDVLSKIDPNNRYVFAVAKNRSIDYEPAISNITNCNFTTGRTHSIDTWVNHWIGTGTYAGSISWFHNCSAQASAQFVIRSSDGQITQTVRVANTAWHCGASGYPYNNSRSIGVEHEATAANPSLWNSAPMINESTQMARYFSEMYSIPLTRNMPGFRGHNEMPGTSTACPGSLPWSAYMNFVTLNTNTPSHNSTNVSIPVSFNWESIGGGSVQYRLQVCTSQSGWTQENGWTTSTNPSSSVPVNINTQSNSNYTWSSGATGSFTGPTSDMTYYYSVKVFDGLSSYYTPPITFSTGSGGGGQGCSGGSQWPNTIHTPTSSWQTIEGMYAGEYAVFNVTNGVTYSWSLCSNDGGNAPYDSELTLRNHANGSYIDYADDVCGNDAQITWTAAFTGQVRVLVNQYNCQTNSTNTTLAYKNNAVVNYTIELTSNPSAGGTTTGGGVFPGGGSRTVTASANTGYEFVNWTENSSVVSTNPSYTFILNANRTLVANFNVTTSPCQTCPAYDFAINPNTSWQVHNSTLGSNGCMMYRIPVPATPGCIYSFKTGCGDGATADFDTYLELYDQNCSLMATNDDGCESYRSQIIWESNYTSSGYIYLKVRGYSAQEFGSYTLAYQRLDPVITYTISTQSNPVAGGTTTGGGSYDSGQQCTVGASTNQGFTFSNWTENGTVVSTNTNYTFSVTGNRTLLANFACIAPSVVTVSGGGTYCNSAVLSASGGAGGTIYFQGTNSNGTSTAVQANSYTVAESGTYYFRAYNGNCWGTAGSATVTINSTPGNVSVSGGGTYCGSALLTATGGSGGTIYFQGTNSNGTSTAVQANSYAVNASGTYYFRAYNGNCWGTAGSATVTINSTPGNVSVSGGGTHCGSAILTATGGNGGTIYFQGTNSNGTSTAVQANSYTVTESGNYYFRAYNGTCWGTSGSTTVTISSIPNSVFVSGGGSYCGSAILTATGGSGGTIYFQGTNSNGTSTAVQANSYTVYQSGTYYFRSYNGHCWGSAGSAPVGIVSIPNTPTISLNDNILSSNAVFGNQWYNQNGLIVGATNQTYVVNETGTYYVVVSNSGCVSTQSNSIFVSVSGIEEIATNELVLYPNPTNHELFIALLSNDLPFQYAIINSIGKVVNMGSGSKHVQVDISNLVNGIYLVRVEQNSSTQVKRFLKL